MTLQFNTHLDHRLPALPPQSDYSYFTCFQIQKESQGITADEDPVLSSVLPMKCYRSIPDTPFKVSQLTNGVYHVESSLLRASSSDPNDVSMVKQENTVIHIKEMIDFHANYEWQYIEDYHSINHGLDVQMEVFGDGVHENTNGESNEPIESIHSDNEHKKMVRIPPQWVLQQFVSSDYRLLWLLVSKTTSVADIKEAVAKHTGMSIGCIEMMQDSKVLGDDETVESVDWFYNKHSISVALDPSSYCEPVQCGFGYLKRNGDDTESTKCDYITAEYHKAYRENKGKMWVDVTNVRGQNRENYLN